MIFLPFRIIERDFADIPFHDPFFDSFRADYPAFDGWTARKAGEPAHLAISIAGGISGFLYLKRERGPICDVSPPIPESAVKIGSFKAENGMIGRCFMRLATLEMDAAGFCAMYITFFPRHERLAAFVARHGFSRHGRKNDEDVWIHKRERAFCRMFRQAAFAMPAAAC